MSKSLIACAAAACVLVASSTAARAQTASPKEEIRAAINRALVPLLGSDSGDVVKRLLDIKPTERISRNFNLSKVNLAVFGRFGGVSAPDCRVTVTPVNEVDDNPCVFELGKRDDETGAYTMLSFSKNIGQGNIKVIKRAAFVPGSAADPTPVKLSDAEAYQRAVDFALTLGVPASEIPVAPSGARNPLPVRSLVAGAGQERGSTSRFTVQKVVTLPRAFVVPRGLLRDPATGITLNHVAAPGSATFAVTDAGVQFARVDGWSDAQFDPKLNPSLAKTVSQLTTEITDDLYNEGVRQVGSMSVLISLRRATPNPDDPNPPTCPACGVLRPALKVLVSQAAPGKVASSERAYVAPGLVREYDLVDQTEAERPAR